MRKRYIPTSWEFSESGEVLSSCAIRGMINNYVSDATEAINLLCENGELRVID